MSVKITIKHASTSQVLPWQNIFGFVAFAVGADSFNGINQGLSKNTCEEGIYKLAIILSPLNMEFHN